MEYDILVRYEPQVGLSMGITASQQVLAVPVHDWREPGASRSHQDSKAKMDAQLNVWNMWKSKEMLTITGIICVTVSFITVLFQHLFNEQIKKWQVLRGQVRL